MEWTVVFDPTFAVEAEAFGRAARIEIAALAGLLRQFGPQLRRPYCDTLSSKSGTNEKRFYRELIWIADKRFDNHLKALAAQEGL